MKNPFIIINHLPERIFHVFFMSSSREKDMKNPFRQMVYDNENEMFAVLGKVSENSFIKQKDKQRKAIKKQAELLLAKYNQPVKS